MALDYVNDRPRLALYYFDWNSANGDYVLHHTHSGGVCLNDTVSQVGIDDLPFGGSGDSGMGYLSWLRGLFDFLQAQGRLPQGASQWREEGPAAVQQRMD